LIPSSPGKQHGDYPTPAILAQCTRPPGLQDFLSGGVLSALVGLQHPLTGALGHWATTPVAFLIQISYVSISKISWGGLMVFISVRKCGARNTAAANSHLLSTTAPTAPLGTWQDLNLYSGYSFNGPQVNKSVNPNEAFGGQQTPVGASAFDGLLPMPPLPKQALNAP
jgi:hypothetical protein